MYGAGFAVKSDGSVVGWGGASVPSDLKEVVAIATSGYPASGHGLSASWHALALRADGTLAAWGNVPGLDPPSGLNRVIAVACGDAHSLVLQADGKVVQWTANGSGTSDLPASLTDVTAIAAGGRHNLALKSDGTVVAWGWDDDSFNKVPPGLKGVTTIAAGHYANVALVGPPNRPPQVGPYLLQTGLNRPQSLSLFTLHHASSDPDWDPFVITDVSPMSAAGGKAKISGSSVLYTPPADFVGNDSFTYTVTDSRGASAQGTVQVSVQDVEPVLGDLNGDGCVDRADLALLMSKIQARSKDPIYDLNNDGKVDVADARFLVLHFTNPDGSPCQP